jgi:hypothetical protein
VNGSSIKITGWKAIPVLVVILLIGGYRYYAMRASLDTEAKQLIRERILTDSMRNWVGELEERDPASMTPEEAARNVDGFLRLKKIDIVSMEARGRGDRVVVRVEITVDGKPPPDGRNVRYFRMRHSMLTGWRIKRETTALSYHLTFW